MSDLFWVPVYLVTCGLLLWAGRLRYKHGVWDGAFNQGLPHVRRAMLDFDAALAAEVLRRRAAPGERGSVPGPDVWIVCKAAEDGRQAGCFEIQGVYSTREAASAACAGERTTAARFTIDRDYREVVAFEVIEPRPAKGAPFRSF